MHTPISKFWAKNFPALLTLATLLAFAAELAHWTWIFAAPAYRNDLGQHASVVNLEQTTQTIAAAHLFGQNTESPPQASYEINNLNLKLKGVFAPNGSYPGIAILNTGAKDDVAVAAGMEIESGIKLVTVYSQYVIVIQQGLLKRIDLDRKSADAAVSSNAGSQLGISPLGYNAFSVSRASLSTALQSEEAKTKLGKIGAAPGGGVLIVDAGNGSVPAMLGLQAGDVLRQINGQFVAAPADL